MGNRNEEQSKKRKNTEKVAEEKRDINKNTRKRKDGKNGIDDYGAHCIESKPIENRDTQE